MSCVVNLTLAEALATLDVMNRGIFSLSKEDLSRLDSVGAVAAFRELLWAEATALSISKNLINIPGSITARDGGVDASVANLGTNTGQGLIKDGRTCYQIKTGEFSPTQPSNIKKILFRDAPHGHELHPKVKSCLEENGTLVVVLFGNDSPDATQDQLRDLYVKSLVKADPAFREAKVEVWRQSTLIGFFQQYPSLVLKLKDLGDAPLKSHASWSDEQEMTRHLAVGDSQQAVIAGIQAALRRDDASTHLQVCGPPGIGKTRMVLEATRADDLEPLVVYCRSAVVFRDSPLFTRMTRSDSADHILLVLDECTAMESADVWNSLMRMGSRLRLVTIHHEMTPTSGRTIPVEIPRLAQDQAQTLIQSYGVPADQAARYAPLCKGSPRAAHVLGQNLAANPEDLLRPPDTAAVWDRWVAGRDPLESQRVRERRVVLRHLALFKGFGFAPPFAGEISAIAALIRGRDSTITQARFDEIVRELRDRRLLQGETTLYITPDVLHIELWCEWWDTYGTNFDIVEFTREVPSELLEGFFEMFRYARESEVASATVARLLGPHGPFADTALLETELGGSFFRALTEANPRAALESLERIIPRWGVERILRFTAGRRQVIEALRCVSVWRDLFVGASRVLLLLAEGENESWANNATGIFVDLFSPAPGRVAPTEASPEERFPVLEEALLSGSEAQQAIAVKACECALSTGPFMRMAGPEHQGLRPEAQLWQPRDRQEYIDAYRRVWELLTANVESLRDANRSSAVSVLVRRGQDLAAIPTLDVRIPDDLRKLVERGRASDRQVITAAAEVLHYSDEKLTATARSAWRALHADFGERDYHSRLRRFVGTALTSDMFERDGGRSERKQQETARLAEEIIHDLELVVQELPWLVTPEAEDGYLFGYELGKRDVQTLLLPKLLAAQKEAGSGGSLLFLSGYVRAASARDTLACENLLQALAANPETLGWVFELTWRCDVVTERTAALVLGLVQDGSVSPSELRMFAYSGAVRKLTPSTVARWLELLLERGSLDHVSAALALARMYATDANPPLPAPLLDRLLLHTAWFSGVAGVGQHRDDDWAWCDLARDLIARQPDAVARLAKALFEHFGGRGVLSGRRQSGGAVKLLAEMVQRAPEALWVSLLPYLAGGGSRSFWIGQWLAGSDAFGLIERGALELFPAALVWSWVEDAPNERAPKLASLVPRDLGKAVSYTRRLLIQYGDTEGVAAALHSTYHSTGWAGPESEHFAKEAERYEQVRATESNAKVNAWLDQHIAYLKSQIQRARIEEEREQQGRA